MDDGMRMDGLASDSYIVSTGYRKAERERGRERLTTQPSRGTPHKRPGTMALRLRPPE